MYYANSLELNFLAFVRVALRWQKLVAKRLAKYQSDIRSVGTPISAESGGNTQKSSPVHLDGEEEEQASQTGVEN